MYAGTWKKPPSHATARGGHAAAEKAFAARCRPAAPGYPREHGGDALSGPTSTAMCAPLAAVDSALGRAGVSPAQVATVLIYGTAPAGASGCATIDEERLVGAMR